MPMLFVVFVWSQHATDLVADLVGALIEILLDLNRYVCTYHLRAALCIVLALRVNVTGPKELIQSPESIVREIEVATQTDTLEVDGNLVPFAVFEVPLLVGDGVRPVGQAQLVTHVRRLVSIVIPVLIRLYLTGVVLYRQCGWTHCTASWTRKPSGEVRHSEFLFCK
jgi:hypothetical protein